MTSSTPTADETNYLKGRGILWTAISYPRQQRLAARWKPTRIQPRPVMTSEA